MLNMLFKACENMPLWLSDVFVLIRKSLQIPRNCHHWHVSKSYASFRKPPYFDSHSWSMSSVLCDLRVFYSVKQSGGLPRPLCWIFNGVKMTSIVWEFWGRDHPLELIPSSPSGSTLRYSAEQPTAFFTAISPAWLVADDTYTSTSSASNCLQTKHDDVQHHPQALSRINMSFSQSQRQAQQSFLLWGLSA
jgi:hypothetical protein